MLWCRTFHSHCSAALLPDVLIWEQHDIYLEQLVVELSGRRVRLGFNSWKEAKIPSKDVKYQTLHEKNKGYTPCILSLVLLLSGYVYITRGQTTHCFIRTDVCAMWRIKWLLCTPVLHEAWCACHKSLQCAGRMRGSMFIGQLTEMWPAAPKTQQTKNNKLMFCTLITSLIMTLHYRFLQYSRFITFLDLL